MAEGYVSSTIDNRIAVVEFYHPKKNSLPGVILAKLAAEIQSAGETPEARVVVLRSSGDGPFCAGASFDELVSIQNFEQGTEFFMGFARVILAMKKCPKFIICAVQGKVVGGGVGIVSAADYTLAVETASIKLSELALGIGPFVVGPAIERKIGTGAFTALATDTGWRDAHWATKHGMYADLLPTREALNAAVESLSQKLAKSSPEAMALLKKVYWEGTENWDALLKERAEMSGRLVLSEYTREAIAAFKNR